MIKLADYESAKAFPAEMRTPERIALAYAFDRQKKKFIERMERAYMWADLEKVEERYLDALAVENRVLFYDGTLPAEVKRNLIQNYLYWHIKLGTRGALEEIINIIFNNENTSIEEWQEYGGDPYHFRVLVDPGKTNLQVDMEAMIYKINLYKRAAARLDGVWIRKCKKTRLYLSVKKEMLVEMEIKPEPYVKNLERAITLSVKDGNFRFVKACYPKKSDIEWPDPFVRNVEGKTTIFARGINFRYVEAYYHKKDEVRA